MRTLTAMLLGAACLTAAAPLRRSVCASGCDFTAPQAAVSWAANQQGIACQEIVLELKAGETFPSALVFPEKSCARYIRLRSSRLAELPAGVRVAPASAPKMAHLQLPVSLGTDRVVTINRGGYWALEGLEVSQPVNPLLNYGLIQIGDFVPTINREALLPHHVTVDRCYIHGQPQQMGPVRGILLNGRHIEVLNSYISEIKAQVDAQAIASLQSPGPLRIQNNYLEASGMSFQAGGAASTGQSLIYLAGVAQRAGRFRGNHMRKRPEWLSYSGTTPPSGECLPGSYYQNTAASQWYRCGDGSAWETSATGVASYVVKNTWELKDGQGYELVGNVLENSWQQAQIGFGILLNQSGNRTRNYDIRDVLIRGNRITRVNAGFAMGNLNYLTPNGVTLTRGVDVEHNTFSIGAPYLRTAPQISRAFTVIESERVRLARNSLHFAGYVHAVYASGDYLPYPTLSGHHDIAENVFDSVNWSSAGFFGSWFVFNGGFSSYCWIRSRVPRYGGSVTFSRNVTPGPGLSTRGPCPEQGFGVTFPADHIPAATLASVLVNPQAGDFTVIDGHAAKNAAWDGGDLGADPAVVATLSGQAVAGGATPAFDAGIRAVTPGSTSALVRFAAPNTGPCTLQVSTQENMATSAGTVTLQSTGRAFTGDVTGLDPDTAFFVKAACGGYPMRAAFRTRP